MFDRKKEIGWFGRFAALCLAVCLLAGCGGNGASSAPASESPAVSESSAEQPEPNAPDSKEEPSEEPGADSPAEPPASSDAEEPPEETADLIYNILDYRSVDAVCGEKNGTLVLVKVRAENVGEGTAHLHNTVQALGNITLETAVSGLNVDKILDSEPMETLTARVWKETEVWGIEPVVAAVNGASEELDGGQSAEVYWYVVLPEDAGKWTRFDFLEGDDRVGYLTPKSAPKRSKKGF